MITWWSTESMASCQVSSSIIYSFCSQSRWKCINLLLRKILKHFSSQSYILNWCNNRCYIHSIRLPWRRLRWLCSCLRWSQLIVLNELSKHVSWQVLNELPIHSHGYGLGNIWIKNFYLLLKLLRRLRLGSLVSYWLVLDRCLSFLLWHFWLLSLQRRICIWWLVIWLGLIHLISSNQHIYWLVAHIVQANDLRCRR